MADAPPTPAPPTALAAEPGSLRLVLFGMPGAGKSSLLAALGQAAQSQQRLLQGNLLDKSKALAELQRRLHEDGPQRTVEEVAPYSVEYQPFSEDGTPSGSPMPAVVLDCDGRVAADMLTQDTDGGVPLLPADGSLARAVAEADTLILVVDASATAERLDADFGEFHRFLSQVERSRGNQTEVGGLPVFLVLSKCDLLAQANDSTIDWIERLEERKREVGERFRAFLTERDTAFGSLDLHLWATAIKRPLLRGVDAMKEEPYGVAELFRECLSLADDYRQRRLSSGRRLAWTVGTAAGSVAAMLVLTVTLLLTNRSPGELQARVDVLRATEGIGVAHRLRGSFEDLNQRLERLREVRSDHGFDSLAIEDKNYVNNRIAELLAYLPYRKAVETTPWPGRAGSEKTLDGIEQRLKEVRKKYNPPDEWKETDAGELYIRRLRDVEALREAARRVEDWYTERTGKLQALWELADYLPPPENPGLGISWRPWSDEVAPLLDRAGKGEFNYGEALPGAGPELRFEAVRNYEQVATARAEWDKIRDRLEKERDVTAALSLIDGGTDHPAVLKVPRDFTLEKAAALARALETAYPRWKDTFVSANLPEAIRARLGQEARINLDYLLPPARAEVLRRLGGDDSRMRWAAIRKWLEAPAELKDWRLLASALARIQDPPSEDPVQELAAFLDQPRFTLRLHTLEMEISDSLKLEPEEDAPLRVTLRHRTEDDKIVETVLKFDPFGKRSRDPMRRNVWKYSYKLSNGLRELPYLPGDELKAQLRLNDNRELTWDRSRSKRWQFESLLREPRLHKAGEDTRPSDPLQDRIKLRVAEPTRGLPALPELLPFVNSK